jgi:hypothetical protein
MEPGELRRYQLIATAVFIVVSGGWAIQRTLSIDPVSADGRKCVIPSSDPEEYEKFNGAGANLYAQFLPDARTCDKSSLQAIVDMRLHPVARILGALSPSVVLAPVAYYMAGRLRRRYAARFKVCKHCAETIKSAAKVCRYCGREVA